MINHLTIRNFKSIKDLRLTCKKMNIFIGEPNTGKSNILEALSLRSLNAMLGQTLNQNIFRYKTIGDLFYDFNIDNPVEVISENQTTILKYAFTKDGSPENQFQLLLDDEKYKENPFYLSHEGKITRQGVV